MERSIRVTGKGTLSLKPDQIKLSLSLSEVCASYDAAVKMSEDKTEALKDCFAGIGFSKSELKTTSFNVTPEYESYRDRNNDYQRKFIGYRFKHSLKVVFDADNALLGKVLTALAASAVCPEFEIAYTVKNPEAAKNELLSKAVADSQAKAKVLADAAGVQLGDIVLIDYSWGEMEIISRPLEKMSLCEPAVPCGSLNFDIDPDDIDLCDTVTVVWSI